MDAAQTGKLEPSNAASGVRGAIPARSDSLARWFLAGGAAHRRRRRRRRDRSDPAVAGGAAFHVPGSGTLVDARRRRAERGISWCWLGAGLLTGAGQLVLVRLSSGNGIDITEAISFTADGARPSHGSPRQWRIRRAVPSLRLRQPVSVLGDRPRVNLGGVPFEERGEVRIAGIPLRFLLPAPSASENWRSKRARPRVAHQVDVMPAIRRDGPLATPLAPGRATGWSGRTWPSPGRSRPPPAICRR